MLPWYHLTWQIYLPTHYADNARLGGGFHRKARKVGTVFPGIPALQPKSGLSATPHKTWPWSSLDCLHYTAFFTRLQARP